MSNFLNSVKNLRPKKNAFNLSHGNSFTSDMGLVVPVFVRDCVPNSDFRVNTHALGRMLATVAPVMDNVDMYMHFWKLPFRIIDALFPKFISGELDSEDYDYPYFTKHGVSLVLSQRFNSTIQISTFCCRGSLMDMLGFYDTPNNMVVSTRKFFAYAILLYYEYRVENIPLIFTVNNKDYDLLDLLSNISEANNNYGDCSNVVADLLLCLGEMNKASGADPTSQDYWKMAYFKHAWRKDYFTACFPYLQKGDPVTIPIGGTSAPVSIPSGQDFGMRGAPDDNTILRVIASGLDDIPTALKDKANLIATQFGDGDIDSGTGIVDFTVDSVPHQAAWRGLEGVLGSSLEGTADLSEATAITINELRIYNALQVYQERKLRYGGRYKEYLKGFFNQSSLDARLDYPEYLGGGKLPFLISEIAQTSGTTATSPQGNLAGKGTAFGTGFAGFSHTHIYEESFIMGILFTMPKPNYCTGTSRFDTKLGDPFDFFNPSFEHVGEQEVKLYEIYGDGLTPDEANEIFGYQPRFAEYRVWNNEVHGEFCSTLSYWKLTRQFSSAPSLSKEFVYIQPHTLWNIFATSATPGHLLIDLYFDVKALQPMSKYGTPMLMA